MSGDDQRAAESGSGGNAGACLACAGGAAHVPWTDEDAANVETALQASDAARAGHWPTVAGWLACEVRRLRAEQADTKAAGDALAGAAIEALSLMEHAIHASSPREQRLRDTLEAWRALHSAPPVYAPVTLPEKPAEAIAAGRSVVCTFCGDEYEHNEVGAVSGYTAACNSCYDAAEPDGVQE